MICLDIQNIRKTYSRNILALKDISFQLTPGVIALVGPNGAGKTTLINILTTLIKPTSGQLSWNSQDVIRTPGIIRQIVGYLPQDFEIYPQLNAWEFLEYMADIKGVEHKIAHKRIKILIEWAGLMEVAQRPMGGYSGGMRQRIGIVQALLNDPQLLILDEPTVGLDPEERIHFRNLLTELAGERIIILCTHIISDVEAIADRIILLHRGCKMGDFLPEDMLNKAKECVWEQVVSSEQINDWRARHVLSGATRRSDGVHLRLVSEERPSESAISLEPSLEDAYLLLLADKDIKFNNLNLTED
ncbi:ABC transporter ATP-binding protein [Candidatus Desantisbacteria bacterium CG23_combo_of_CG06-09_8_20_14_all_40_23]|uniref:ABC transporter ATP-binding protein n=1 Tax=Candidatus Desantisbacteria bacterium CG23_combo_of_CG06-09_8_20_14_all_40_23 TaxID=1974550 RepID=A0A2H0AAH3_9BACT|nr:MAG: ABC transporter ATP-binding protein [Candidatus Desantisbacteria bacterium CG23_combo_of_CG06-09_8_20_14_all_40_23]